MTKKRWMKVVERPRPGKPGDAEKATIIRACEAFIHDVLKPRFLPEIRPNEFNFVIDIIGEWRAGRYRFMQRYRSDAPNRIKNESTHLSRGSTSWGRTASTYSGCGIPANGTPCIMELRSMRR